MEAIERADALLVVGSSLQVFSGFRFCRRASELGRPIAILNPGKTRADSIADIKLEADCQALLPTLI
jgi:NAD-dependent SIR2 family protein deacetylase